MDQQRRQLEDFNNWLRSLGSWTISNLDMTHELPYLVAATALILLYLLSHYIKPSRSYHQRRPHSALTTTPSTKPQTIARHPPPPTIQPEYGTWTPSRFHRPPASPYPNWSHVNTPPLPYRPFRHGPYTVTMGLRKMHWDDWIELDNEYLRSHADKRRRIESYGSKCCRTDGDERAFGAAVELLEDLVAYLGERYPGMFRRILNAEGEVEREVLENVVTGEVFDVKNLTVNGKVENPMQLCARLVQDDIDILFEREDGQYYLGAAGDFLSGVEKMEERMGMSLSELHTSSGVPYFEAKLEKGMMNFFRRLKPENPIVRHNYFIQVDKGLEQSIYGGDGGPAVGWEMVKKDRAIEHHWFRTERQTLRRLPRSGGVVFTIRTYLCRITEIAEEPGVAGRLASAVRSWDGKVAKYKGREKYEEVLLEYLDRKCAERKAEGLNDGEDDEDR